MWQNFLDQFYDFHFYWMPLYFRTVFVKLLVFLSLITLWPKYNKLSKQYKFYAIRTLIAKIVVTWFQNLMLLWNLQLFFSYMNEKYPKISHINFLVWLRYEIHLNARLYIFLYWIWDTNVTNISNPRAQKQNLLSKLSLTDVKVIYSHASMKSTHYTFRNSFKLFEIQSQ